MSKTKDFKPSTQRQRDAIQRMMFTRDKTFFDLVSWEHVSTRVAQGFIHSILNNQWSDRTQWMKEKYGVFNVGDISIKREEQEEEKPPPRPAVPISTTAVTSPSPDTAKSFQDSSGDAKRMAVVPQPITPVKSVSWRPGLPMSDSVFLNRQCLACPNVECTSHDIATGKDLPILSFRIPFIPISINEAYVPCSGSRTGIALSPKANKQGELIYQQVRSQLRILKSPPDESYMQHDGETMAYLLDHLPLSVPTRLQFTYCHPIYYKNGRIKNWDTGNPFIETQKFLKDNLNKLLVEDDMWVFKLYSEKVDYKPAKNSTSFTLMCVSVL